MCTIRLIPPVCIIAGVADAAPTWLSKDTEQRRFCNWSKRDRQLSRKGGLWPYDRGIIEARWAYETTGGTRSSSV